MKFLTRFQASRLVGKLRADQPLPADEAQAISKKLLAYGEHVIPQLISVLSHGVARVPAINILRQQLSTETAHYYLDSLRSGNPAQTSAMVRMLSESEDYDPQLVLAMLSEQGAPMGALRTILEEQMHRVNRQDMVRLLGAASKDAMSLVFRLLERHPDPSMGPDLIQLLKHDNWWVRLHSLRVLGEIASTDTIQAVSACLNDENREVRLEAVRSLDRANARDAAPALVEALRDQNIKVQTAAIDALTRMGDSTSVSHLIEVLKDESEYARRAAVEVLNAVATTEAVHDLVKALQDEDWWVRVRAADALGSLGGPRVVEAVIAMLEEKDEFVRRYAVEILNTVPSEKAVEPLVGLLYDHDWWVRERSIDALGAAKDPRAVQPLIDLMLDTKELIPLCARALAAIGDVRAVLPLVDLYPDLSGESQETVTDALVLLNSSADLSDKQRKAVAITLTENERTSAEPDALQPGGAKNLMELEAGRSSKVSPTSASKVVSRRTLSEPDIPTPASKPAATEPPAPGLPASEPPASEPPASGPAQAPQLILNYHQLEKGTELLDRFTVVRKVGAGGFGSVYLVRDKAIQDEIILKVLNPQLSADDTAVRRFVRELKLTRRITHKNVIRLHDFLNLGGGAHAVSMEYFESLDLGKILKRGGPMGVDRAFALATQICDGLTAAHSEDVVHRDIKPENILVGHDDEVKIVDFGLASAEHSGSRLTKSGLLVGTPEYIAPELINGEAVDHRADIYAVGVMLYEMVSGTQPYTSEAPVQVLLRHIEGEAEALGALLPDLDPAVCDLIHLTMAREPDKRPQTAEDLKSRLQELLRKRAA